MNFGGNKQLSAKSIENDEEFGVNLSDEEYNYEEDENENIGGFCFGANDDCNDNPEKDKDTRKVLNSEEAIKYQNNVFYDDIANEADDLSDERDEDAVYTSFYDKKENIAGNHLSHETFRPGIDAIPEGYEIEPDMTTYDMMHEFGTQWPLLSIDIINDFFTYDKNPFYRTTFPHSVVFVGGEQTNEGNDNLIVGHIENLKMNRTKTTNPENEEEEDEDSYPRMETRAIAVGSPINRIRTCSSGYFNVATDENSPFSGAFAGNPALAACFTANGVLSFIDLGRVYNDLNIPGCPKDGKKNDYVSKNTLKNVYNGNTSNDWKSAYNRLSITNKTSIQCPSYSYPGAKQFFGDVYSGDITLPSEGPSISSSGILTQFSDFGCEGYGLAFNPLKYICISGDNSGKLRMYQVGPTGDVTASNFLTDIHKSSIEDIVFARKGSSLECGIFATCSTDKSIALIDPRLSGEKSVHKIENAHDSDVNVIDWNYFDDHFLLSGGDDGAIKVWDIRNTAQALKTFKLHKGQVSSVAWSPDYKDPLSFVSCGEDNMCYFWDLDCEGDDEIADDQIDNNFINQRLMRPSDLGTQTKSYVNTLPKELMFVHMGLQEPKEVRYHQQIPGSVLITHNKGVQIIKPFNSGPSYDQPTN